jgi:hypothetical protein
MQDHRDCAGLRGTARLRCARAQTGEGWKFGGEVCQARRFRKQCRGVQPLVGPLVVALDSLRFPGHGSFQPRSKTDVSYAPGGR